MEKYLKLGTVIKPHGIKGEIKILSTSFFSDKRYENGKSIFTLLDKRYVEFIVEAHKHSNNYEILKLKDLNTIEEVEFLNKKDIFALKDPSILEEGQYYFDDLIGLDVTDTKINECVGVVVDIEELPAQLTLKIKKNDKFYYVPYVDAFIEKVDLENNKIYINMIEGMYED